MGDADSDVDAEISQVITKGSDLTVTSGQIFFAKAPQISIASTVDPPQQ